MTPTELQIERPPRSARISSAWTSCVLLVDQVLALLKDAAYIRTESDPRLDAARLEPRILLSATPIAPIPEAPATAMICEDLASLHATSTNPGTCELGPRGDEKVELIVIDARVQEIDALIESLRSEAKSSVRYEVLKVSSNSDGLEQISEKLSSLSQVDAIHVFSHGTESQLLIGATLLSSETVESHSQVFFSWRQWLADDADLMLYGCDVAADSRGEALVARIGQLTGADVAASIDSTGHSSLGGNWDLEFVSGTLESDLPLSASAASNWNGLLQAITVTTTNDVLDGNTSSISALLASRGADGLISLREAIIASNATVGADVIILGSGTYSLSLVGLSENSAATGDLDIRDDLEILGTGNGSTTINGGAIDRVFEIRDTAQVTIQDLTIRGGNIGSGDGGGIYVFSDTSSLTLRRVLVTNHTAGNGAGIYVREGILNVYETTISNNTSTTSGGGIYNESGAVNVYSSAILQNSATTSGGGIQNDGSGANLSLNNVTISGNSTSGQGGGLYNRREATIVHSTVVSNSAASGGGIFIANPSPLSIRNSILALNTGSNANTTLTGSLGNNLSNDASAGLGHATDLIVADPKLGALGNYGGPTRTISLLSGSAAINAGAATGATQVDQRGFTRDISADIGAFEYQRILSTGELLVNTTNGNNQETSAGYRGSQRAVAISSSGEYVVVWSSNQSSGSDASGDGVLMRRFSANGTPISGEVQVNQFTSGDQRWATVAMDDAGNGVIAWTSAGQDGDGIGIYARLFDSSGAFVGNEFRVNTTTTGDQTDAAVAMNGSGQFIVVWNGNGSGDSDGVFFRRFNGTGTAIDATDRRANGTDRGTELAPAVAINDAGQFAITWQVEDDVYLRHFGANGTAVFADTLVNSGSSEAYSSAIGIDSQGRTVVVYRADGLSGIGRGVWGRGFNVDGTQRYNYFAVASTDATSPSIDMNSDGSFIVVWNDPSDSSGQAVRARRYSSSGTALAAASLVNATQTGEQQNASVAMLDTDNYVVVWSGEGPGDSAGVFARQFGNILATNTAPIATNDSYTVVGRGGSIQVESYPDWFNQSWQYRQKLTVPLANASVELHDFPVLVKLHASAGDAINIDYSRIQSAGQDLRFVDNYGNLLNYQIQSWNTSGYSYVWVKIPLLENADQHNEFVMYYGNSAAAAGHQPSTTWDSSFAGVYHFHNSPVDSSTPSQNGTETSITYAAGISDQAATFNGTTSVVNLGSDSSLDNVFAGGGTISAWINPTGWGEGGFGRIVDKASSTTGAGGFSFQVGGTDSSNGQILFEHGFSGTIGRWRTNPGTVSLNTWQNVVVVYDNSSVSNTPVIYINGVQQNLVFSSTPTGTANSDAAQNLVIGNHSAASTRTFDGRIDEVRISRTMRDASWINQELRTLSVARTTSSVLQFRPTGLLVNDTDSDNDPLTVTIVSGPTHASSFVLNADGSFTYQHNSDTATTDSFVYRLDDGQGGITTATANLTIQWTNAPPTISAIANQTLNEDTGSGPIAFTVGDVESNLNDLVITSSSSNQSLIANADLVLTGSGSNRQLSFIPRPNAYGTATITLTVSDGLATSTRSFNVVITATNDAPTISSIADQTLSEDTASNVIPFTIGDIETATGSLVVTATSNNQSLVANAGISLTGGGANRSLTFTPQSNANGSATITVSVSDGTTTTNRVFNVTVNSVNDLPTISAIDDQMIESATSSNVIAFTVSDADQSLGSLVVTATSSNTSVIANSGIALGGSNGNRTIVITSSSPTAGAAMITVSVDDGYAVVTRSFEVLVRIMNAAPIAVADSLESNTLGSTVIGKDYLLSNDLDNDGDALTIEITGAPSNGTLTVLANGDFSYNPNSISDQADSFSYRVFDGFDWSDSVLVTLNVNSNSLAGLIGASQAAGVGTSTASQRTVNESTSQESSQTDTSYSSESGSSSAKSTENASATNGSLAVTSNEIIAAMDGRNDSRGDASATPDANPADSETEVAEQWRSAAMVSPNSPAASRQGGSDTATENSTESKMASPGTDSTSEQNLAYTEYADMVASQPQFWNAIESMKQEMASSLVQPVSITAGAAATTTAGMSVGYVVWVLRSGLLLSSVMTQLPMWRFMDPLAILDSKETRNDEDEETLNSIAQGDEDSNQDNDNIDDEPVDAHRVAQYESEIVQ